MRSSAGESELGTERNDYEDNEAMSKLAELWRERERKRLHDAAVRVRTGS